MQVERYVRTLGFFCVLGFALFLGGCGTSGTPMQQAGRGAAIQKEHGARHKELSAESKKAHATQAAVQKTQAAAKKGAHRGKGG